MKQIRFVGIFLVCFTLFASTGSGAELTERQLIIQNRAVVDAYCAYAYIVVDEKIAAHTGEAVGYHVKGWVRVPSGRSEYIQYRSNHSPFFYGILENNTIIALDPEKSPPSVHYVPAQLLDAIRAEKKPREYKFEIVQDFKGNILNVSGADKSNLKTATFHKVVGYKDKSGGMVIPAPIVIPGPVEIKMEDAVEIAEFDGTKLQVQFDGTKLQVLQEQLANFEAAQHKLMETIEHRDQMIEALESQLNVLQKHLDPKFDGVRNFDGVYDTQKFERQGKDYALLFATNTYQHWDDLDTPISDAEAIGNELEKYGFAVDIRKNVKTRADILNTLMAYAQKDYQPGDQLFVYFTGYGNFSEKTQDGYIAASNSELPKEDPAHATYLSYAELERYLDRLACQRVLLVLNVDYGGTFDDTIALGLPTKDNVSRKKEVPANGNRQRLDLAETLKVKTRWYVTSGGKEEVEDGLGQNSPFASSLLTLLRDGAGNDGVLTVPEIEAALPGIYRSELSKLEKVYNTEINLEPISGPFDSRKQSGKAFVFIKSKK